MNLRPYQTEFVDCVLGALVEFDRVLGVAATGSGKTCIAGEIARRCLPGGPVLFLADAQELVKQAADKLAIWSGAVPAVEMADDHAQPGQDRLIVATTQSIARRLEKYPADYFRTIIVDEAHRNTLGAQASKVLGYFSSAQVVGITATPFRSDKQQLGSFYQSIPVEIGLIRLIREGFLSRISLKSVPAGISLKGVRTVAGDYQVDDLGAAVAPHLQRCAQILKEHAAGRRAVVFLPLIETSKAFVEACRAEGLRAVHVDGNDREDLKEFVDRKADIICNASLLTTGWDEPSVDCVMILRPTKSFVLYSQMVGRGTRTFAGKQDLLLLDPLFLSDNMDLIKPARLIAHTAEEQVDVQKHLESGEQIDLFEAEERATVDRTKRMREKLEAAAKRKIRSVDAIEFALTLGDEKLANYEPEAGWESDAPSAKQIEILERNGFDSTAIKTRGQASRLMDLIFTRRSMGLATPKQLKWLIRLGHISPATATFEEATAFLDEKFGKKAA